MKSHPRTVCGFTLVELVVVLASIGLIAVLVGIRLESLPRTRAYFAVRKMRSDVRYAQLLAVQTQKRTRIVFSTVTDQYQVDRETTPGTWVPATDPASKSSYLVSLNSGDFIGVRITQADFNGASTLIFDSYGAPLDGAGNPIAEPALAELNSKYQIRIRSDTGKADIVTL